MRAPTQTLYLLHFFFFFFFLTSTPTYILRNELREVCEFSFSSIPIYPSTPFARPILSPLPQLILHPESALTDHWLQETITHVGCNRFGFDSTVDIETLRSLYLVSRRTFAPWVGWNIVWKDGRTLVRVLAFFVVSVDNFQVTLLCLALLIPYFALTRADTTRAADYLALAIFPLIASGYMLIACKPNHLATAVQSSIETFVVLEILIGFLWIHLLIRCGA